MRASEIQDPDWIIYYLDKAGPLDIHLDSAYPKITTYLDNILNEVRQHRQDAGHQIQHPNRLRRYLKIIILDLLVATVEGESPFRYVSLDKTKYRKSERLEKIHLGSYLTAKAVFDALEALGYITIYPGWYAKDKEKKSRRTRIAATDKLIEAVPFNVGEISYDWQGCELVQLRHEGVGIDYAETPYSRSVRGDVKRYNALAEKTDIRIDGVPVINKYQHAVFHGKNMNSAVIGRMYGGVPQNLKKERRKDMTVEGERLVNLDFKSHHIRIAYHLAGMPVAEDPYIIPEVELGIFTRDEVKQAVNTMLNCETHTKAVRAVGMKQLVEAVEAAHPMLCEYNVLGKRLQKEDADLMRGILAKLVSTDVYAINLHDGLLCRESDWEFVNEVMNQEYRNRFKEYPVIDSSYC